MSYTWFRFYNDAVNDPKVQRLPPPLFKFWVNTLCLASNNKGTLPSPADMAFILRMSASELSDFTGKLVTAGLLDQTETGLKPHNWDHRQFKSDSSTERVQRFRNASKAVSETGPDQTRPDTERKKALNGFVVGKKKGNGHTVPDPANRLALFQKWLAETMGEHGWKIVGEASDPTNPNYPEAVAFCKKFARENGKGWPHQWPT